jgi:hypothetical protein
MNNTIGLKKFSLIMAKSIFHDSFSNNEYRQQLVNRIKSTPDTGISIRAIAILETI